jgi:hypothetical protein
VLRNPAKRGRAVPLTYEQSRLTFANALSEPEGQELYTTFEVPGSGVAVFRTATANLSGIPWPTSLAVAVALRRMC